MTPARVVIVDASAAGQAIAAAGNLLIRTAATRPSGRRRRAA